MGEKDQRVTVEDLARMIQENVAKNQDIARVEGQLDRMETNLANLVTMVEKLPERLAEKLLDTADLHRRLATLEAKMRDLEQARVA